MSVEKRPGAVEARSNYDDVLTLRELADYLRLPEAEIVELSRATEVL